MKESEQSKSKNSIELDAHRALVMWLFLATLVLTVVIGSLLLIEYHSSDDVLSILPVVIAAGILGAFVSALNRIYSASDVFPVGKYTELLKEVNAYLIAYASIPPLVGAISAVILHVIFASEILTGPFFPTFACKVEQCNNFQSFLADWGPDKASDYAKTIVWAFVAGFSERFVPDILNRVVKSTDKSAT